MNREILSVKNLRYSYDLYSEVLKAINLTLFESERVAVVGKNGSGKSTLFHCLKGLLEPQFEALTLKQRKLDSSKETFRNFKETVGLVFQNHEYAIVGSTVEEDMAFGLLNLNKNNQEIGALIEAMLKKMGLEEQKHTAPHFLSLGQKRKLSIASVLIMNPEIILFDEPFAFLDNEGQEWLRRELDELMHEGRTLVISSHDSNFIYHWADRVIALEAGGIIFDGAKNEFFTNDDVLKRLSMKKPELVEIYEAVSGNKARDYFRDARALREKLGEEGLMVRRGIDQR